MGPATEPQHRNTNHLSRFIHSTAANFSHLLTPKRTPKRTSSPSHIISTISGSPPKVFLPLPFAESPVESTQNDSPSSGSTQSSAIGYRLADSGSDFLSLGRIRGLKSGESGGPAFLGRVFSMCDITGTGLMAVSTQFDIPVISKRAPEWIKKMFSVVTKNESGPVFRFFLDLGDAVSYVKQLNNPSGVVGACQLDLAYEHFKEKPHLFQFVPNARQVKEASRLLRGNKRKSPRKIDGVPVFSAENLNIAIATSEGIKWYTPYFFDKSILDNILEESVDQHFDALIQTRDVQRQRDVIDDNLAAEVIEESADSIWEPTEVQELMDEIGQSGIPLSVISKAAEMELQYAVDKVLLGNRWLRKATGIQPKFPYMVDSFERRTALAWSRASKSATSPANLDIETRNELAEDSGSAKLEPDDKDSNALLRQADLRFPLGAWLRLPWSKPHQEPKREADTSMVDSSGHYMKEQLQTSRLLPTITMVGIATTEPGPMSKATIKKTMEDLSKELEQEGPGGPASNSDKCYHEDRDPLFVANVGDYYSNMGRTSSPRWVRGMQN